MNGLAAGGRRPKPQRLAVAAKRFSRRERGSRAAPFPWACQNGPRLTPARCCWRGAFAGPGAVAQRGFLPRRRGGQRSTRASNPRAVASHRRRGAGTASASGNWRAPGRNQAFSAGANRSPTCSRDSTPGGKPTASPKQAPRLRIVTLRSQRAMPKSRRSRAARQRSSRSTPRSKNGAASSTRAGGKGGRREWPSGRGAMTVSPQSWARPFPGGVRIGRDPETAELAVEPRRRWGRHRGSQCAKSASELRRTAEGGGSQARRRRLWKGALPRVADELRWRLAGCRFPPGTGKWNTSERRMFSQLPRHWRGRPRTSHEVIVKLIRSTTTRPGLRMEAGRDPHCDPTGMVGSDPEMARIQVEKASCHGEWTATIIPRRTLNGSTYFWTLTYSKVTGADLLNRSRTCEYRLHAFLKLKTNMPGCAR